MKERPILFQGAMVRALLAGTKTQTRRLMKPQPSPSSNDGELQWPSDKCRSMVTLQEAGCLGPYGSKGDRLWVRESFCENYFGDSQQGTLKHGYKADWSDRASDAVPQPRWTPSIHMPRWASRITLEVTSVRVERLQSITEEDAKTEGVEPLQGVGADQPFADGSERTQGSSPYTLAFAVLWDTINGDRASWQSNPWLWVVSFRRLP